jgi:hypothetical protein
LQYATAARLYVVFDAINGRAEQFVLQYGSVHGYVLVEFGGCIAKTLVRKRFVLILQENNKSEFHSLMALCVTMRSSISGCSPR